MHRDERIQSPADRAGSIGWLLLPPLAVLLVGWGIVLARGFDGLYGQDAFAYANRAAEIRGALLSFSRPGWFWWPDGYPLAVALVSFLGVPVARAGQLTSLLAGAGLVLFCGLLAHGISRRVNAGLIAGLFAASSGAIWLWQMTVMSDVFGACLATAAAWRAVRPGRWAPLAGPLLAAAITTRWIYLVLVVPFAFYWIIDRRVWRQSLLATAGALIVVLPQLAQTIAHPEGLVGNPWLLRWTPLNAFQTRFLTQDGAAIYDLPPALFGLATLISPSTLPAIVVACAIAGLFSRRRSMVLVVGWPIALLGYLAGVPFENGRFLVAVVPPVVVLGALGAAWLWSRLPRLRGIGAAFAVASVLFAASRSALTIDAFLDRKESDQATARWAERLIPARSRVFSFDISLTLAHYTSFEVYDLFEVEADDRDRLAGGAYLLVRPDTIARQWSGLAPDLAVRSLSQSPGLTRIGTRGEYTLSRIGQ